jgi:hypothetical protein
MRGARAQHSSHSCGPYAMLTRRSTVLDALNYSTYIPHIASISLTHRLSSHRAALIDERAVDVEVFRRCMHSGGARSIFRAYAYNSLLSNL